MRGQRLAPRPRICLRIVSSAGGPPLFSCQPSAIVRSSLGAPAHPVETTIGTIPGATDRSVGDAAAWEAEGGLPAVFL